MYSKEFCDIYNEYGWDYFSLTMGDAILRYFKSINKNINSHLDLACGTGTLCNYFYNHNIKTSGIDISKDMVQISKNKNDKIDFIVGDITNYIVSFKYDLITATCDAVNHILDKQKLEQLFSNVYSMLEEDGYFIFDIFDKQHLDLYTDIIVNRDNGIVVNYYITDKDDLINTNVKVSKNDKFIYEYNVLEKIFDKNFIKCLLEKYKFKIVKIDDRIMGEEQRFKDKIYVICKK